VHERQEIEQYFFSGETLDDLARLAMRFHNPCCLCTPSLGEELEARGVEDVTTLDLDARFAFLKGFREYDISEPEPLDETFGVIICDPPFLSVSLERLFQTVELLSHGDHAQSLLINYLADRARVITRVFSPFGLRPTGYYPGYANIQNLGRNRMELYGNLGPEHDLRKPQVSIY
jgi:hypothetical protein